MTIKLSKTPLPDFNATVSIGRDSVVMTPDELLTAGNALIAMAIELWREKSEKDDNDRLLARIQKANDAEF